MLISNSYLSGYHQMSGHEIIYLQGTLIKLAFPRACSRPCLEAQTALSSSNIEYSNDRAQVIVSQSQRMNVLKKGEESMQQLVIFLFCNDLSRQYLI